MINFLIGQLLNLLDWCYTNLYISQLFTKINDIFTQINNYSSQWDNFMSIIFFVVGKPLIVFCVGVGVTIIIVKIVFGLIHLIGQFVP